MDDLGLGLPNLQNSNKCLVFTNFSVHGSLLQHLKLIKTTTIYVILDKLISFSASFPPTLKRNNNIHLCN